MFNLPLYLIPLFPLIGAILNGSLALRSSIEKNPASEKWVKFFGVLFPVLSFLVVLNSAIPYLFQGAENARIETLFEWIASGNFKVDFAFRFDRLSTLMTLVVTGVGSLIHLYSTGYMTGDKSFARYFAYLNLFLFAMLLLVLGDNLLILFIGWEGVGLCSYLLIGFWFEDPAKASAGKKAFIVNRIGDFGFLLGIFIIVSILIQIPNDGDLTSPISLLSFDTLARYKDLLAPMATAITLLLFVGATGKSAQIPLYVWLPDAMAGPTPVSALIHAATMVTAGVYMIARLSFLYDLAPFTREIVATVGAVTALFAATIGITQRDIKKVLAYSTVSQLGYMFLGVGIGATSAGVFHLMTHAFFKACLFLGSGSVIHAMHGEQDIFKMGGLKKWMPITFFTFLISTLAIAGIPPFSGFFSKDEILWQTFSRGYFHLWIIAFLAAGITSFYMFRLVILTFLGKPRMDEHTKEHLHESPWTMTLPLVILAILATLAGGLGVPHALGGHNFIHQWLEGETVSEITEKASYLFHSSSAIVASIKSGYEEIQLERFFAGLSVAWAFLCALLAYYLYSKRQNLVEKFTKSVQPLYRLILNKYYVDEIYDRLIVKPIRFVSEKVLWRGVDAGLIDGLVINGSAKATRFLGELAGIFQTGIVNSYALYFLAGIVGLVAWLMLS